MKTAVVLILLTLCGCESMNKVLQPRELSPAERANLEQVGLQLMQMGQPQVQSVPVPTQTNCIVYPPNAITGQSQVVCH